MLLLFREVLCFIWNQKKKLFHVPEMSVLLHYATNGNDFITDYSESINIMKKSWLKTVVMKNILLFFLKIDKMERSRKRKVLPVYYAYTVLELLIIIKCSKIK